MKNTVYRTGGHSIATFLVHLLSIMFIMSGCSGPSNPNNGGGGTTTTSLAAPVITKHPASQAVKEDSTATLSVAVTAVTGVTFTYQWKTATKGTTSFTDVVGATSASYTTPALTAADNGTQYQVVVTATNSQKETKATTSDIAILTVSPAAPVITTQPISKSIQEGGTVKLSVVATADRAALSYQWQTAAKGATVFTDIPRATSESYTTPKLTVAASGVQYRVVVKATSVANTTSTTISHIATISVFSMPPPNITGQPASQTIEEGNTASLGVVATAATGATLSYQWQTAAKGATDFTDIPGATSASYTTPTLNVANSGVQYQVLVTATNATNMTSHTTSDIATITVNAFPAPVITTQPASKSIQDGGTVSLSVVATTVTGATLSYQWQTAAKGTTVFTDISGAASDNYTIPSLTVATSGVQYRVVVKATSAANITSTTISRIATISVFSTAPPNITTQPASQTIKEGNTASLSVVATAATTGETLSYQWQKAAKGSSSFADVAGATSNSYTTPVLAYADNGVQYRVVVTAMNTTSTTSYTTSDIATITVNALPPAAPSITTQPVSKSTQEGGTATLSVVATATGATLSYQWQRAEKGATDFADVAGATSNSYTTPVRAYADSGERYRVVVTATNAAGLTSNTTSNIATILVSAVFPTAPSITMQPASQTINEGDTAKLSVAATAATGATLSYQWQKAAKGATDFADVAGATSNSYTTPVLAYTDSGVRYRVVVTATNSFNRTSRITSNNATITVNALPPAAPSITTQPVSQTINEGDTAKLSVVATATGATLSYQWQKAAKGSSTFADVAGATSSSYTTPVLAYADSGVQYRVAVKATNAAGLTSSTTSGIATILVKALPPTAPNITTQPASQMVAIGNTATLSVAATTVTGITLSYQWQKAARGSSIFKDVAGATSASYTTDTLRLADSGVRYSVVITATNASNLTSRITSDTATISVLNKIVWTNAVSGTQQYTDVPADGILKSSVLAGNKDHIKSVDGIPTSITTIANNAFESCSNLTSINIPSSVTSIGNYTFKNCSNLASIAIPNTVTSIGAFAFENCKKLVRIALPSSVTTLGESAFISCEKLANITMPGVINIGQGGQAVFGNCASLTSVTIPSSVTDIGNYAFWSCATLVSVRIEATSPPNAGEQIFLQTSANLSITVPRASVDAYKGARNWSTYADKITGY